MKTGIKVIGKHGEGVITKIITKSTGYVEVAYNSGFVKKDMAFNLTDENGNSLKKKPVSTINKVSEKLKITSHVEGGFSSMFSTNEEKQNWLEQREIDARNSISF